MKPTKRTGLNGPLTRRAVTLGLAAARLTAGLARAASDAVEHSWNDLLPQSDASTLPSALQGLIEHDQSAAVAGQPQSTGVRTDWNGETVQMSGFVVPLDYSGTGVTAFILVPYVGACIHVPPPPSNQLVLVTTDRPYENDNLFEPVTVTGMFGTASNTTQLAEIGYALSADRIAPYDP